MHNSLVNNSCRNKFAPIVATSALPTMRNSIQCRNIFNGFLLFTHTITLCSPIRRESNFFNILLLLVCIPKFSANESTRCQRATLAFRAFIIHSSMVCIDNFYFRQLFIQGDFVLDVMDVSMEHAIMFVSIYLGKTN